MALAWVLRDPRVTSALIGASSVEQLETNVAALENLEFTDEELAEIDQHAVDAGHQHLGAVERRVNRREIIQQFIPHSPLVGHLGMRLESIGTDGRRSSCRTGRSSRRWTTSSTAARSRA